jgi:hypothetical protein
MTMPYEATILPNKRLGALDNGPVYRHIGLKQMEPKTGYIMSQLR